MSTGSPIAATASRDGLVAILVHSVRMAVACGASLLVARLFRLPEAYSGHSLELRSARSRDSTYTRTLPKHYRAITIRAGVDRTF